MRFRDLLGSALFLTLPLLACTSSTTGSSSATPCNVDDDCPAAYFCTWPTTAACGQKGSCIAGSSDASSCTGPRVCPCTGGEVIFATCSGVGEPVTGNLGCLHAPCSTNDQCNTGLICAVSECVPGEAGAPDASTAPDASSTPDAGSTPDSAPAPDATTNDSAAPTDSGGSDATID